MKQIDGAADLTRAKTIGLALLLALPVIVVLFPIANKATGDAYQDAEVRETQHLQSNGCISGKSKFAGMQLNVLSWSCDGTEVRQFVHSSK